MMLTYCCKVTIIARSCSSLVWWRIPSIVVVVVGEIYAMAMVMVMMMVVMVMISCRRMNNLLHLYL